MKKASQSNWFLGILALMFALLLFFNANSQGTSSSLVNSNQVYDEMLYNVPVQLEYDQNKYFVSGYEETVDVHLSSANRIQLNLESNEDTRNFQVVADLTNLSLGTSEIKLQVKGLSTAVTAEIEPKTITATIEKKVTKSFDVQSSLPDSIENEGYTIDNIDINPKTVSITTGEETAKAIDRVVAPISDVNQPIDTINQTVNVQVLDSKGQALSIENPAPQVKVTVDLVLPSKEVGISANSVGTLPAGVDYYTFAYSTKTIEIKGAQSVLNTINSIDLSVDITDVKKVTKRKIKIPTGSNYISKPEEVEVTIQPIFSESNTTYSGLNTTGTSYKENRQNSSPQMSTQTDASQSSVSSEQGSSSTEDEKNDSTINE